jgi:hypothetical protein
MRKTRKYKKGGGAGKLEKIAYIPDNSNIIGAGNFGLVVKNRRNSSSVIKLFYDIFTCNALPKEAALQIAAQKALKGIALVPKIKNLFSHTTNFKDKTYLCGIEMERVPIPDGFDSPVHMLLGYDQYDIDTEWGRSMARPVGPDNPTRGFHAGPAMLEAIWEDEGTDMTIENLAFTMGKGTAALLEAGILPLDIEWIYGGNGLLYVIDFGLAEFRHVDKNVYLLGRSSESLSVNYYVPKPGMRGWEEFYRGFTQL